MIRFLFYLIRWQLSTPILAIVTSLVAYLGYWYAAAIANAIGACLFFWIDRIIFNSQGRGFRVEILNIPLAKEEVHNEGRVL